MTPIFDSLVNKYFDSDEIAGLAAGIFLDEWYHDRGWSYDSVWD